MTESNNQNAGTEGASVSPEWEMRLAREVRNLDRELMPNRDLWSGIERRIEAYPQPKKAERNTGWMQYGIAASVLMAFSALALTVLAPGASAQRTFDQDKMKSQYEEMLTHDWYKDGGWTTDFEAAKKQAKKAGVPIFAYFMRTYAP